MFSLYHQMKNTTVRTIQKTNIKIIERVKSPNTKTHDRSLSWLGHMTAHFPGLVLTLKHMTAHFSGLVLTLKHMSAHFPGLVT
jgi:hypothetical protein